MKPFNLERALAGDPVVTRSGSRVTGIYRYCGLNADQKIFFHIEGNDYLITCDDDGIYCRSKMGNCNDLFMATKVKKYYLNIYRDNSDGAIYVGKNVYISEAEANDHYVHEVSCFLKTVSFEVEE